MIAPDSAVQLRAERRFDLVTALLIGAIAVLAAILSTVQIGAGQAGSRANLEAARLSADLSARIAVNGQAVGAGLVAQQTALMLGMEATARQIAGLQNDDDASTALGKAEQAAYAKLSAALAATTATSGGKPVDAYTASLIGATAAQIQAELAEQNRQVDLANTAGSEEQRAVLGLSLLALAGVLTGLAAVLREGRSGRLALGAACAMAAGAASMAVLAIV